MSILPDHFPQFKVKTDRSLTDTVRFILKCTAVYMLVIGLPMGWEFIDSIYYHESSHGVVIDWITASILATIFLDIIILLPLYLITYLVDASYRLMSKLRKS